MHDRAAWAQWARRHHELPPIQPTKPWTPNKYHAIPIHVDGVRFASKREAARFLELQLWQKAGQIADLETQPVFPLHVLELWRADVYPMVVTTIGKYTADFRYLNLSTGEIVVEDVKCQATKTTSYRLRKRLAECIHGMTVTEIE